MQPSQNVQAVGDETFVVLWHEGDGDVKDQMFCDLDEANERFDTLDGGPYATILVNGRFNELRYYGTRGTSASSTDMQHPNPIGIEIGRMYVLLAQGGS